MLTTYLLLTYVSLVELVQPMDNYHSEAAKGAMSECSDGSAGATAGMMNSVSSQTVMLRSVAYAGTIGYVLVHIPIDAGACKAQLVLAIACLDGLLLYGHLWDRVPSLQVAINCRFMYAWLMALLNIAAFVAWAPYLATPFLHGQRQ